MPQCWSSWAIAELDGALALLDEAQRRYAGDFSPLVRPIAALTTRVWLAHGRVGEALGWARERRLSAQDELSYLREFEHITLARVLLAQHARDREAHAWREAEDYVRMLVREGPPMEHLLREAAARGVTPGYARRLLAVCSTNRQTPALPIPPTVHRPRRPRR